MIVHQIIVRWQETLPGISRSFAVRSAELLLIKDSARMELQAKDVKLTASGEIERLLDSSRRRHRSHTHSLSLDVLESMRDLVKSARSVRHSFES